MGASVGTSLGVVLCTTPVSRRRRRDGGDGAKTDSRSAADMQRAAGRMPDANVRRWGTGSPEPSANQQDAQVENLRYERRQRARARAMSGAK